MEVPPFSKLINRDYPIDQWLGASSKNDVYTHENLARIARIEVASRLIKSSKPGCALVYEPFWQRPDVAIEAIRQNAKISFSKITFKTLMKVLDKATGDFKVEVASEIADRKEILRSGILALERGIFRSGKEAEESPKKEEMRAIDERVLAFL